jgi:hypothetical protein
MTSSRLNLIRPDDEGRPGTWQRLFDQIEGLLNGQSRNRGSVTLTANAASTTVNDARFQSSQSVVLCPMTANAAAALATTYVSARNAKSFVLTHANNAQADKTFEYIFAG